MARFETAKRLLDLVGASIGLIATAPLLIGAAVAIRTTMGSPVLFSQRRPGLHGRPFTMYKFRTMRQEIGRDGEALPDAQRLTHVGRLLRATSIDELPELWNVLRGEMSLVGPRPLLMKYLPRYSPAQARRHDVKPGVTGWAQIHGRNALDWADKFELDVWYVDNRSLCLDLRILAATVRAVLRRDGIGHGGEATMPEFAGIAS